MSIKCDVLVIGAGPAGSSAARAAAMKGLKTIIIEEHDEIGSPVQCAEGIGEYLFPYMPFKIPEEQLIWKMDGMFFWANNIAIKKEGGIWSGYSIDRFKWDQWMASLAQDKGVEIQIETCLQSMEFDNNYNVSKVEAVKNGKKISFNPKFVVAADGVESTVLECLGKRKNKTIGHIKSFEMKNLKLKYPRYEQLFFGEFAPQAYAYIFPLSETRANIGIGTIHDNKDLDEYFNKFVNIPFIKRQLSEGAIVKEKSGDAPVKNPSEKIVYGNVFLVGDVANQNIKPFIEGNIPSIICGNILGDFISDVASGKETSDKYEKFVNKKFNLIYESEPYTDIVYGKQDIPNEIFNFILLGLMTEIISPEKEEIEKFVRKGYEFLQDYILKNGGFIEK